MKKHSLMRILRQTVRQSPRLAVGLLCAVIGAVAFGLLPPLVLEKIINRLAGGMALPFSLALLYFVAFACAALSDALKEMLIPVFGQKVTHGIRRALCEKLSRLPADYFLQHDSGGIVSRFVGDVDTVEALFASGIVGMLVDVCKVLSILAVIFVKSTGLGLLLLAATPLLFLFTRCVQKRMLRAQLQNRAAVGRLNRFVPETLRNLRMLRNLRREQYMEQKYDTGIAACYEAVDKVNFYDAVYSPAVTLLSTGIIAVMMILAASGGVMQTLFGMSVGTAVAVIAYVGKVFAPIESIGMEIQSIQSAVAGVQRITELLEAPERPAADLTVVENKWDFRNQPAVSMSHVTFAYGADQPVLRDLSVTLQSGENLTLVGRTGAGKSTVFRLLLDLYTPQQGTVQIFGAAAAAIPDAEKRRLFGYVAQQFRPVPGTVAEQISVFDATLTQADVENAARLAGLHEALLALPEGYETVYREALFSQGQRQLLAIARAVAAEPKILLLDEITANLDAETEEKVLRALRKASGARTVLSISHRLYLQTGGRKLELNGNGEVS